MTSIQIFTAHSDSTSQHLQNRVCGLLLLCLWLVSGQSVWAQQEHARKKINLQWAGITYPEALNDLEKQTGAIFYYSTDLLPGQPVPEVKGAFTLKEALQTLLKGTGLGFSISGQEVTIYPLRNGGQEERGTFSGRVVDGQTNETLVGVSILVTNLGKGTVSNMEGFFSLNLPLGHHQVKVRYLGYLEETLDVHLTVQKQTDIRLTPGQFELAEVVINDEGAGEMRNVSQMSMSSFHLNPKLARSIPALLGEPDPIKTLQLLPGVPSSTEGSVGLFVRGGGADQNLVLMDNAPVYNTSHFGFFSIFNPDALKNIEFSKGGIHARYGGRLSSVLDAQIREGNREKMALSGGIGTLSTRATLEGPFAEGKGSFLASGRRTYADLFFQLVPDQRISGNSIFFYDLNLKASYRANAKNNFSLSSYLGSDSFGFQDIFGTSWGNQTVSAKWSSALGPKWFAQTTAYMSRFRARSTTNLIENFGYISRYNLLNVGLRHDVTFYASPQSQFDAGGEIISQRYFFGAVAPIDEFSVVRKNAVDPVYALEKAAYVNYERELGTRFRFSAGLRFSQFANIGPGTRYLYEQPPVNGNLVRENTVIDSVTYRSGQIYHIYRGLEPRLLMRYLLGPTHSIKFSYNRTRQHMGQLTTSNIPSPVDMWAPVNPYIQPQIGDQVTLGYFKNFAKDRYEFSVEGYYKQMLNQIDFRPQANLLFNNNLETEILQGEGTAYGLEFFLRKVRGRLNGWAAYTYSRSERQIGGINNNQPYPASFDRRHDISLVAIYRISPQIELSANWVYSSGQAFTFPVGKYEKDGFIVPYYTSRNGFRLPPSHRMDVSVSFYRKIDEETKNESSFNFSVYNAYNRKNAFAYVFRQSREDRTRTEVIKLYLFSIIPSFTYNFKF
jgi:hypothetical protein